jgi:hypothetical protein
MEVLLWYNLNSSCKEGVLNKRSELRNLTLVDKILK